MAGQLLQEPPLRGIVSVAGGKREGHSCSSGIRSSHVKSGIPPDSGLADALRAVFLECPCRRDAPYAGAVAPAAGARTRGPGCLSSTTGSCACRQRASGRNVPASLATSSLARPRREWRGHLQVRKADTARCPGSSGAMRSYWTCVSSTCLVLRIVQAENMDKEYSMPHP